MGSSLGLTACSKWAADEAEIIIKSAEQILNNVPTSTVVDDLNERKIPTVKGGPWTVPSLVGALTSRTVAGETVHRGQVIATASHPAILDAETSARLRAMFDNRRTGPKPKVGLLTGMLFCGICRSPMQSARSHRNARIYRCPSKKQGGCNSLQVVAARVEAVVIEDFKALTATKRFSDRLRSKEGDAGAIAAAQDAEDARARLTRLADLYAAGDLTEDEWQAARARVGKIVAVTNGITVEDPLDPAELGARVRRAAPRSQASLAGRGVRVGHGEAGHDQGPRVRSRPGGHQGPIDPLTDASGASVITAVEPVVEFTPPTVPAGHQEILRYLARRDGVVDESTIVETVRSHPRGWLDLFFLVRRLCAQTAAEALADLGDEVEDVEPDDPDVGDRDDRDRDDDPGDLVIDSLVAAARHLLCASQHSQEDARPSRGR